MKILPTAAVLAALVLGCNIGIARAEQTDAPSNVGAEYFTGVIIYAKDVERSVKFYTDIMGLKVAGRVEKEGRLVEILLSKSGKLFDGAVLTLQPTNGLPERSDPARLKFGIILFMTKSNASLATSLQAAGFEATARDPLHLLTHDPDGYQIMTYQFDDQLKARH